jgi:hypothetical protein
MGRCRIGLQPGAVGLTVFLAAFGASAAQADLRATGSGWHESYDVDASAPKLIPGDGVTGYSLEISGADADSDWQPQVLQPGETSRKTYQFDGKVNFGSLVKTEFRSNFAEVLRDPDNSLGNLQGLGETGSGSRELTGLFFKGDLFNGRVSLSLDRQGSTWAPIEDYRDAVRGTSQQLRFSAILLRSDSVKWSIDGVSSRVEPDFHTLTDAPVTDALLTANRSTSQFRSTVTFDRFEVNAFRRESGAIAADPQRDTRPHQSETGAGASVSLSDLRSDSAGPVAKKVFAIMPDSIWVSASEGAAADGSGNSTAAGALKNYSVGATRNWSAGDAFLSYWQSVKDAPQSSDPSRWSGHGIDFGGNLYFGQWTIYGGMSLYSSDNLELSDKGLENSFSGTFLASWKPAQGPAIRVGATSYRYGYAMLDYGSFTGSNQWQYEAALDFSDAASARLHTPVLLNFLAGYRASAQQSRWENAGYGQALGGIFTGFRLDLPLRH